MITRVFSILVTCPFTSFSLPFANITIPGPSPIIIELPSLPVILPGQSTEAWCDSLGVDTVDLPDACLDICDATNGEPDVSDHQKKHLLQSSANESLSSATLEFIEIDLNISGIIS
jgi:hypothetical protein